jgi:hypothetical protein
MSLTGIGAEAKAVAERIVDHAGQIRDVQAGAGSARAASIRAGWSSAFTLAGWPTYALSRFRVPPRLRFGAVVSCSSVPP